MSLKGLYRDYVVVIAPEERNVYSSSIPRLAAPPGAGSELDQQAHCAPMERTTLAVQRYKHCAIPALSKNPSTRTALGYSGLVTTEQI